LPISAFIGLAFTFVLDWVLIPRMGIQGAALASSVAYVAAGFYLFVAIRNALRVSWGNLLIPSWEELLGYQRLWLSLRSRYWPGKA